jgi:hypothetical protein
MKKFKAQKIPPERDLGGRRAVFYPENRNGLQRRITRETEKPPPPYHPIGNRDF